MKPILRFVAVFLLFFLGFGGIYGAMMLISDPSGGNFGWTLDLLNGTPFDTFLIPGIVLLIINGLFPVFVAIITLMKRPYAYALILVQGAVLIVWLSVQLILNPKFFLPVTHYPSYSVGILLVVSALLLSKLNHESA